MLSVVEGLTATVLFAATNYLLPDVTARTKGEGKGGLGSKGGNRENGREREQKGRGGKERKEKRA